MRNRRSAALVIAAMLTVAVMAIPVSAHEDETTHVEQVTTSRSGNTLFVSGTATFVDQPATIMTDAGDGTLVDVTSGTISRAPGSTTLQFKLNIDAPTTDFPNMVYLWPIAVDGGDTGLFLMGSRMGFVSTSPTFILARSGEGGFSTVTTLQGSLTASSISWNVPMFRLGANDGSVVSQGSGSSAEVRTGMAGGFYCCTTGDQFDSWFLEDYRVPGATVQIGIAPAGTPPAQVSLSSSAVVTDSSFSGGLDVSGLAPGDYVVVAKACYGSANCGLASTDVTI